MQGSGKTHTMFGPDEVLTNFESCDPALWGLVPRATEQLFEGLRHGPEDSTFLIQCSYLEVSAAPTLRFPCPRKPRSPPAPAALADGVRVRVHRCTTTA